MVGRKSFKLKGASNHYFDVVINLRQIRKHLLLNVTMRTAYL